MRSSRVDRALAVNVKVATVLGWIPASFDTVESEGAAEAVLKNLHKKKKSKKFRLKKVLIRIKHL
jgi:hypothetical protein